MEKRGTRENSAGIPVIGKLTEKTVGGKRTKGAKVLLQVREQSKRAGKKKKNK